MQLPSRAVAFAALLSLACTARAEIVLVDDAGRELRFAQPVTRIVALAPHLAEMTFDAGAGNALVGAVEWSDHPPAAKAVPRVGDGFRIDAERILALRPEVVLAWGGGTPEHVVDSLRALGLGVAVLAPRDLADIPRQIEWLGVLTGNASFAQRQANAFREGLERLRRMYAGRDSVRVFYQISAQPLFTVGAGHTITELVALCGGENIFGDLDQRAHAVSREAVLARDPEAIIAGRYAGSGDELTAWQRWQEMTATRAGNLFSIDAERVARPTLGIIEGGQALCATLDRARENLRGNGQS